MEDILHNTVQNFLNDPLLYIGMVLSAYAVIGFLTFLRGFIAGSGHVIANSGHNEHQEEARVRATWGLLIVFAVFLIWETLRFVASWFGYATVNTNFGIVVSIILLLWIGYTLLLSKKGGH